MGIGQNHPAGVVAYFQRPEAFQGLHPALEELGFPKLLAVSSALVGIGLQARAPLG